MLEELEAPARRKKPTIDDIPERRTVRSVAHLQIPARHNDADQYMFLASKLEEAGRKTAAAMARRWALEHRRVAATLMNTGDA